MKSSIPSLTGVRLVAALSVVVGHAFMFLVLPSQPNAILNMISNLSGFGMTLFFVLSGFVIHMNYAATISTREGLRNFAVARLARLYPLYVVLLLIDLAFHCSRERLIAIPFYLTLTQTWFYLPIDGAALVSQFGVTPQVSWSISTEWFFYFAFPLLAAGVIVLGGRARKIALAISLLCAAGLTMSFVLNFERPALMTFGQDRYGPIGASSLDSFYRWLAYFSPYVRVFEFALGCLMSALVSALKGPSKSEQAFGFAFTGIAIAGIVALQWTMFADRATTWLIQGSHMNFGFAPLTALLIFCCARYRNPIVGALSSRAAVLLGEASYSIYLVHLVIIFKIRDRFFDVTDLHGVMTAPFRIFIAMSLTLVISFVLWRFVEMPARRFVRSRFSLNNAHDGVAEDRRLHDVVRLPARVVGSDTDIVGAAERIKSVPRSGGIHPW
jgi:peptidoglycan/LPS O-acetylase OafA/YrhL